MDDSQARQVCQLIAGIVVCDDDLDPSEDAFIDRVLTRFGIPTDDRGVILPILDSKLAAESMRALPTEIQEEALGLLIEAACADGKVTPEEREYLDAVGEALDLSAEALSERVATALSDAPQG